MALLIENISDQPYQELNIDYLDSRLVIELRYFGTLSQWMISVRWKDRASYGSKLSLGVLHFKANNFPFDFRVIDNRGTGIDPNRLNDFSAGYYSLIIVEADELRQIRGYNVEI